MKRLNYSKVSLLLSICVITIFLSLTSVTLAAEDTWTIKADMPTARLGLATSAVNGKIYAIGGGYSIEGPHSGIVEEYNPVTDTWTRKADMPTGRIGHAASVVDGKIYVFGGDVSPEVSCSTVEEYDPAIDTWTIKADMPTERTFLCSCTVDGKIYVIGGITAPAMQTLSTVEVYDPSTDTWTTKADMLTPRSTVSVGVVDGRIYVVGGSGLNSTILRITEEYDPTTDTWTRKADMPTQRMALSTSSVNRRIYAIGGAIYGTQPFSTVEEYDPITDTWTVKTDMPTPKWFFSTSIINGRIYAIGGSTGYPPHSSVSTVEEYDTGFSVPSPDFNGDGIVDINDLVIMIENWETNETLCDIAPMPWGDGIVDRADLEVFMEYYDQVVDVTAYWKLDEAEGLIAYDSSEYSHDANVIGDPNWQPDSGMVDGALEFDGINDYVSTPFVLNPNTSPLSVFAWIKGGDPGQVILSQADGANWLSADISDGALMTELKGGGRSGSLLISQTVITDDNWHRIGLTWDGTNRTLYVDDIVTAEDTQPNLLGSEGGLYIGAGNALDVDTLFQGLIDDVRIYDRVITP